jgi:hypothetical protein
MNSWPNDPVPPVTRIVAPSRDRDVGAKLRTLLVLFRLTAESVRSTLIQAKEV